MNICIDIDGTITTEDGWVKYANAYFHTFVSKEDLIHYDIHQVLGISREVYDAFYEKMAQKIHAHAKVRPFAQKVLKQLAKDHRISYVTARASNLRKVTEKWMFFKRLPKAPLYMMGSHYKVDKAKDLSCHIFIEDRYENAVQLSLSGFQVILMDCPYNQKNLLPNMKRVYSWQEIHHLIQEFEAKKEGESVLFHSKKKALSFEF